MTWIIRSLIALCLCLITGASQSQWAIFQVGSSVKPVTQRSVLDIGFLDTPDYIFIDMFMQGAPSPTVSLGGTYITSALLDAQGFPCTNIVNTNCPNSAATNPAGPGTGGTIGFGAAVPANTTATPNYTGYYCAQGFGTGKLQFQSPVGGTWTIQAAGTTTCGAFNGGAANNCTSSNVTIGSVSTVTDTWTTGWCVALTYTGPRQTGDQGDTLIVSSDDLNSNGYYIKGVHLYQQPDGADFASGCPGLTPSGGCLYRHAFKQTMVTQDYAAIRFLDWTNWSWGGRFEDRPTPVNQPYPAVNTRYAGLLPYPQASRTSGNIYAVSGVTGTPTSMKHGEQVIFEAPSAGNNGYAAVSTMAIAGTTVTLTYSNPVTAGSSSTGFSTGDVMMFFGAGLQPTVGNLYRFPVTVTVDSTTQLHFTYAGAAGLTPCSSNCGRFGETSTLQVGSGSDRTAYPILDSNGEYPIAADEAVPVNTYSKYCFSKVLVGTFDGSGNANYGAWWACGIDIVPLEYITELINEINALNPAHPTSLWLNLAAFGMVCSTYYSDPDCASGSDYPLNAAKTIINGANGYAGLQSPAKLFLEHGNETWDGSAEASMLSLVAALPAASGHLGCGQNNGNGLVGPTLMSELAMQDVQTVYPIGGQVKYTMGLQGGFTGGAGGTTRIAGPLDAFASSCVPAVPTGLGAPIALYDYANLATYVDGGGNGNLTTYATQWASDVNTFGFSSSQAATDLAVWAHVVAGDNGFGSGTLVTNGSTAAGNNVLHFASVPSWVAPGMSISDTNNGVAFFGGTTPMSTTSTTVTLNQNVNSTVNSGDTIVFNNGNSIAQYETFVQTYETAIAPYNKFIISYEGGWNDSQTFGEITGISCTGSGVVTVNATATNFEANSMVINNVSVAGYNGVFTASGNAGTFTYTAPGATCPAGTPTTDFQGFYGFVTTLEDGFKWYSKMGSGWSTQVVNYLNWSLAQPHTGMPNLAYVYVDTHWGLAAPDPFGPTNTEAGGVGAAWTAIGNFNRAQQNFLLKRDLDPAANDNTPMWLNEAA